MRYLLDTDICSYFARGSESLSQKMLSEEWAISSLTAYELRKGIVIRGAGEWSSSVEELIEASEVLPFDESAAKFAADLTLALRIKGMPSGTIDELLAGHALSLGAIFVTNNQRHYAHIPGLKLESWL